MDQIPQMELGRTGLKVGRLGLGAGYSPPAETCRRAFEAGINYFYWTSRKPGMARAIREICAAGERDRLVVAVQSYSRSAWFMERSLVKALKELNLDRADVFLLGWYNKAPSEKLLKKAEQLKQKGLCRFLGMTGHNRALFPQMAGRGIFDLFHIRYNAAHRGAETESFPHLGRAGVVTYTATRWGHLLQAKRMPPGQQPPTATDCYRFVLSNPSVDICLCGPNGDEQLNQALAALDKGPMTAEELERMRLIGDHVHAKKGFFQR